MPGQFDLHSNGNAKGEKRAQSVHTCTQIIISPPPFLLAADPYCPQITVGKPASLAWCEAKIGCPSPRCHLA